MTPNCVVWPIPSLLLGELFFEVSLKNCIALSSN